MLAALVAGERDPEVLAELAKGRLRKKIPELRQALRGRFGDHHALLVGLAWTTPSTSRPRSPLDDRVDALFAADTTRLMSLSPRPVTGSTPSPGSASGPPSASSPRSASTCPGSPTAGAPRVVGGDGARQQHHRRQAPLRQDHQGQPLARATSSTECAWAAARTRDTYLVGPVLAARPPHRQEEGRHRRRPLDPGHLLAPAHQRLRLPTTSAATTSPDEPTPTANATASSQLHDLGYHVTLTKAA